MPIKKDSIEQICKTFIVTSERFKRVIGLYMRFFHKKYLLLKHGGIEYRTNPPLNLVRTGDSGGRMTGRFSCNNEMCLDTIKIAHKKKKVKYICKKIKRSGAADVLEALGVKITLPPEDIHE